MGNVRSNELISAVRFGLYGVFYHWLPVIFKFLLVVQRCSFDVSPLHFLIRFLPLHYKLKQFTRLCIESYRSTRRCFRDFRECRCMTALISHNLVRVVI